MSRYRPPPITILLANRNITIPADDNAALGPLVRGTSAVLAPRRFAPAFWRLVARFSISVWPEWAASEWYIAGAPSRNFDSPFYRNAIAPSRHERSSSRFGGIFPVPPSCFYTDASTERRWESIMARPTIPSITQSISTPTKGGRKIDPMAI